MPLQSDPTVVYGITEGKAPLGRALTRKDLKQPTAYNTYQIAGLPPGPIANPGRAALEAAVQPAESDYFYFVAAGDGGHAFAKPLAAPNANVATRRTHPPRPHKQPHSPAPRGVIRYTTHYPPAA